MLPQASGKASARTPRMTGAFHGAMPSTTPAGWRTPIARLPGTSDGMTSPPICVVMRGGLEQHAGSKMDIEAAHRAGRPVSAAIAAAKASAFASRQCAALVSKRAPFRGPHGGP